MYISIYTTLVKGNVMIDTAEKTVFLLNLHIFFIVFIILLVIFTEVYPKT